METQHEQDQPKKNPPLDRVSSGAIELAVWVNQTEDGREFASPGKIVRISRDEEGKRVEEPYLRDKDLLDVAFCCQQAHQIIKDYQKQQAKAKREDQP